MPLAASIAIGARPAWSAGRPTAGRGRTVDPRTLGEGLPLAGLLIAGLSLPQLALRSLAWPRARTLGQTTSRGTVARVTTAQPTMAQGTQMRAARTVMTTCAAALALSRYRLAACPWNSTPGATTDYRPLKVLRNMANFGLACGRRPLSRQLFEIT